MHNNLHVKQHDNREFGEWLALVGDERAKRLLRQAGLSSSMAYKLILGNYPHRLGILQAGAVQKAMLKR